MKNKCPLFNSKDISQVLGDVFLKYRASMFLYYNNISNSTVNKTNINEGELTLARSKVFMYSKNSILDAYVLSSLICFYLLL